MAQEPLNPPSSTGLGSTAPAGSSSSTAVGGKDAVPRKPKPQTAAIGKQSAVPGRPRRYTRTVAKKKEHRSIPRFLRLSIRDKVLFSKHLAVMLEAGIPLHEALGILKDQVASPTLRAVLKVAVKDLADGLTLHITLAKFPKLFDKFFTNAISVGETSGTLESSLRHVAEHLEKDEELQRKVRGALLYPAIVFMGAIGIASYLAFFLLPRITPLFTSLKVELPFTTRALLAMSAWFVNSWMTAIGVTVAVLVVLALSWRIKALRYAAHRTALVFPVFGLLAREVQTAQFSRILGTLLMSGVQIVPALMITADSLTNLVYRKKFEDIAKLVEQGQTIGSELTKHPQLFTRTAVGMVAIGEKTGKLSDSLLALAEFSEREVDGLTKNLTTLIEPLTLILVGVLVGFVALSIITPIYKITQGISQ